MISKKENLKSDKIRGNGEEKQTRIFSNWTYLRP